MWKKTKTDQVGKEMMLVYVASFFAAFCSLIYELQYSQLLSILYGNTVMRYSLTIGIYLFSLGVGAVLFGAFSKRKKERLLWISQMLLGVIGPLGIIGIIWADSFFFKVFFGKDQDLALILAHIPIVLTGLLAGFQIPILSTMGNAINKRTDMFVEVLGVDYFGSLLGSLLYGLFLYPYVGLIRTALLIGLVNIFVAGISLVFMEKRKLFTLVTVCMILVFMGINMESRVIEDNSMRMYLNASLPR